LKPEEMNKVQLFKNNFTKDLVLTSQFNSSDVQETIRTRFGQTFDKP